MARTLYNNIKTLVNIFAPVTIKNSFLTATFQKQIVLKIQGSQGILLNFVLY